MPRNAEKAPFEKMKFYGMDKNEHYDRPPTVINSEEELMNFIVENVEKYFELRLVDFFDMTTMQIVDQSLVFPLPEGYMRHNKWRPALKRFMPTGE